MLIIPAIDIIDNEVVRLSKGRFDTVKRYGNSPLQQAILFQNAGFEWVHIVDLLGSKMGKLNIGEILKDIKSKTNLNIEFGGGVRTFEIAEKLASTGVDRMIIGSLAVQNKKLFESIVDFFGTEKIIPAADIKDMKITVEGWTEKTSLDLFDHIKYCIDLGLTTFLCTDITKDGMLNSPNFDLYCELQLKFPRINVIVSGGISSMEDIFRLKGMNIYGVVVGKAIYENKIKIEELAQIGK